MSSLVLWNPAVAFLLYLLLTYLFASFVPVAESTQVTYYFLCSTASTAPCCPLQARKDDISEYEAKRNANKAANERVLDLLDLVKVGMVVHIPASTFPDEEPPAVGYWVGKTVSTRAGGAADIGIKVDGEPLFTRPRSEVVDWLET